jgi:hypothetical protein
MAAVVAVLYDELRPVATRSSNSKLRPRDGESVLAFGAASISGTGEDLGVGGFIDGAALKAEVGR